MTKQHRDISASGVHCLNAAEHRADEPDPNGVAVMINTVMDGPAESENAEFIRVASRQVISDEYDQGNP